MRAASPRMRPDAPGAADIRISDAHHGPPDARVYRYLPTYILRGLADLHLAFDPVG